MSLLMVLRRPGEAGRAAPENPVLAGSVVNDL